MLPCKFTAQALLLRHFPPDEVELVIGPAEGVQQVGRDGPTSSRSVQSSAFT